LKNDFLQKFIFEDLPVRGCMVRLVDSWHEVLKRAQPDTEVLELLGQALCAAALLGSSIKFEGAVSLQIQSSGSLRLLLGQCSSDGQLRGIARRNEKADQETLLKNAVLSINLEPENNAAPYQGIVSMEDAELSHALELYFSQSEQIETRFWFTANPSGCAGFVLQKMPGKPMDGDDFERLVQLASTLSGQEMMNLEPERLLHLLFNEDSKRLFEAQALRFGCKCSKQRVGGVLQSLGQPEMESLLHEQGMVKVNCEYCGKNYSFDSIDIASLFAGNLVSDKTSSDLH
jgi:molecular chaperone Hsp33